MVKPYSLRHCCLSENHGPRSVGNRNHPRLKVSVSSWSPLPERVPSSRLGYSASPSVGTGVWPLALDGGARAKPSNTILAQTFAATRATDGTRMVDDIGLRPSANQRPVVWSSTACSSVRLLPVVRLSQQAHAITSALALFVFKSS